MHHFFILQYLFVFIQLLMCIIVGDKTPFVFDVIH